MKEVEIKVRLTPGEYTKIQQTVATLSFIPKYTFTQKDCYYNGIDRDFSATDEALRVRYIYSDAQNDNKGYITYKGSKQDQISMTRRELEVMVSHPETAQKLLEALGFRMVATVQKSRQTYCNKDMILCLDKVDGLGYFLELEMILDEHTESGTALNKILACLSKLYISKENM